MSGPPQFLFLTGGTGLIGRMTAPKTRADLEGCGLSLPNMTDCLARTLRYSLDTNWGGKRPVSHAHG